MNTRYKLTPFIALTGLIIASLACGKSLSNAPISDNVSENQPPVTSENQFNIDDKVIPPGDGVFLVDKGTAVELTYQELFHNTPRYIGEGVSYPATSNPTPIILDQLPDISVTELDFLYLKAGTGFYCVSTSDNKAAVVKSISAESGAAEAGLQPGDIIISVNGENTNGDCDVVSTTKGILGSSLQLTVLRGTTTLDMIIVRKSIIDIEKISYTYVAKGQFVQLIPDQYLTPGMYCYAIWDPRRTYYGWCFQVSE